MSSDLEGSHYDNAHVCPVREKQASSAILDSMCDNLHCCGLRKQLLTFHSRYLLTFVFGSQWAILSPTPPESPLVPTPPLQDGCNMTLTVDEYVLSFFPSLFKVNTCGILRAQCTCSDGGTCQVRAMNLMKITDLAIAWGGQLAFDTIVLAMTLWRSLHIRKLGNHTLIDVLIRDGESWLVSRPVPFAWSSLKCALAQVFCISG